MELVISISKEDYEKIKSLEQNITDYQTTIKIYQAIKDGKLIGRSKYIDGDLLFEKIAGHCDYHGDNILTAISCLQQGKELTKSIKALGE